MLPLASRSTKDWGTPFNSFWCCYGSSSTIILWFQDIELDKYYWSKGNIKWPGFASTIGRHVTNSCIPDARNFLCITTAWISDDKLTIQLPLILTTEPIDADRPFTTVLSAYELQQWGLRYLD